MAALGDASAVLIEFFFEREREKAAAGSRRSIFDLFFFVCSFFFSPLLSPTPPKTRQLLVLGALFALSHPPSLPDVSSSSSSSSHAAPFSSSSSNLHQHQQHHPSSASETLGNQPSLAGADAPIEGHHKAAARDDVFAVVVDAGSTGSRVHVFRFGHGGSDGNALELEDDTFEAVTPGLSSYAADPKAAAASLDPLLDLAMATVPAKQHKATTLTVGATAGLRLLPGKQADDILDAVRVHLKEKYPFAVDSADGVTVLDGQSEGAFAWLTLNYLLGHLGKPAKDTVAAIDLGERSFFIFALSFLLLFVPFRTPRFSIFFAPCWGTRHCVSKLSCLIRSLFAPQSLSVGPRSLETPRKKPQQKTRKKKIQGGGSVQHAYALSDPKAASEAPPGYVRALAGGGKRYSVYVHSYLGFGLMAGRSAVLKQGETESSKSGAGAAAAATAAATATKSAPGGDDEGHPCVPAVPCSATTSSTSSSSSSAAEGRKEKAGAETAAVKPNPSHHPPACSLYRYGDATHDLAAAAAGSASFAKCSSLARGAMSKSRPCGAPADQCSFDGAWGGSGRPSALYVSSYFFDRAVDAGIIDENDGSTISAEVRPSDLRVAGEKACSAGPTASDAAAAFPAAKAETAPFMCLDLAFQHALLTHGFGLEETKPVTIVKKVSYRGKEVEAAWPLGAALNNMAG